MIYNFEVPRSDQTSESECDWSNLSFYSLNLRLRQQGTKNYNHNILLKNKSGVTKHYL